MSYPRSYQPVADGPVIEDKRVETSGLGPKPRVLVTGSRAWADEPTVRTALTATWRRLGQPFILVHGACPTGADRIAADWATEHSFAYIEQEPHPAEWRVHGRGAGPIRNADMVALGAVVCLAFPLGESRGTRGCMERAARAGIPVEVHGEPPVAALMSEATAYGLYEQGDTR